MAGAQTGGQEPGWGAIVAILGEVLSTGTEKEMQRSRSEEERRRPCCNLDEGKKERELEPGAVVPAPSKVRSLGQRRKGD